MAQCYYLMSFDQDMIIDATTGSAARFVNHSCEPNCKMIKWVVSGQPRMALFAGDKPIMTGDELTYDYNFDPFSAKNVQACLCGSDNCRGVLGPRSSAAAREKEAKEKAAKEAAKLAKEKAKKQALAAKAKVSVKATVKTAIKMKVQSGKRKASEMLDKDEGSSSAKKRKIAVAKGVKRSVSAASLKVVKGAAKGASAIKRSVSASIAVSTSTPKTPAGKRASTAVLRKSSTTSVLKKYGKSSSSQLGTASKSSVATSATIVAAPTLSPNENKKPKSTGKGSPASSIKSAKTPKGLVKRSPFAVRGSPKVTKSPRKSMASPRKGLDLPRVEAKIRVVPASVNKRD